MKEGTLANVHPQLTVKGEGFNRLLGGLEIDFRLQRHLAQLFEVCSPKTKTNNSENGGDKYDYYSCLHFQC